MNQDTTKATEPTKHIIGSMEMGPSYKRQKFTALCGFKAYPRATTAKFSVNPDEVDCVKCLDKYAEKTHGKH